MSEDLREHCGCNCIRRVTLIAVLQKYARIGRPSTTSSGIYAADPATCMRPIIKMQWLEGAANQTIDALSHGVVVHGEPLDSRLAGRRMALMQTMSCQTSARVSVSVSITTHCLTYRMTHCGVLSRCRLIVYVVVPRIKIGGVGVCPFIMYLH